MGDRECDIIPFPTKDRRERRAFIKDPAATPITSVVRILFIGVASLLITFRSAISILVR